MKQLKRSIILCFVGTTSSLTIAELVLALLFREFFTSYYGISGAVAAATGTLVVNIIMCAALIMVLPAAWPDLPEGKADGRTSEYAL